MSPAVRCRLPSLPSIKQLMEMYNTRGRKQLSQNFLLDTQLAGKLVRQMMNGSEMRDASICEIGPGPGTITRQLLEQGPPHRLVLIEKDPRFFPFLRPLSEIHQKTLVMHNADVLRFDMGRMWAGCENTIVSRYWEDPPPDFYIIGNLPFQISTRLICLLLRHVARRDGPFAVGRARMLFTFQEEVADGIVASSGDKPRSRLSVICQMYCKCELTHMINGENFHPIPDVNCGVVRFTPYEEPYVRLPFEFVERFIRYCFHNPNKIFIKALQRMYPKEIAVKSATEVLKRAGIDPSCNVRQLNLEEFRDMMHVYYEQCHETPGLHKYMCDVPLSVHQLEEKFGNDPDLAFPKEFEFVHEKTLSTPKHFLLSEQDNFDPKKLLPSVQNAAIAMEPHPRAKTKLERAIEMGIEKRRKRLEGKSPLEIGREQRMLRLQSQGT